ncbi:MAG: putative motility protein [Polyangiaceae bacterium]|nr:putative motility protein [Polyangiaceae bacterium]
MNIRSAGPNVEALAQAASSGGADGVMQVAQTSVLKKAINSQAQLGAQLIASAGNVGRNVNFMA